MGISVVFLDFDGVLNSHRFMLERVGNGDSGGGVMGLDPKAVAHINYICGKTDASFLPSLPIMVWMCLIAMLKT